MSRNPQQARSRSKVASLLEASKQVLITRGYENFTTNHVAAQAGCNIGTLYRYFPDKEALIRRVYALWLEEEQAVNAAYLRGVQRPVDPTTFVTGLFRHHLESHDENEHKLAIELTKALYLSADIAAVDRNYEAELVALVGAHVEAYTGQSFSSEQIGFVFKLAVSLLIMINRARPEERKILAEMAEATMGQAVQSAMR